MKIKATKVIGNLNVPSETKEGNRGDKRNEAQRDARTRPDKDAAWSYWE
jgi:hypothetical protein